MDHSDMLQANFEQLKRRYYDGTRAPWAAEMLEDSAEPGSGLMTLANLGVSEGQSESWKSPIFRAAKDLLAYYSIVEVAAMAGCMPEPLPEDLRRSVQKAASNRDLVFFCERQRRILPPLLGHRLGEGRSNLRREPSDEGRRAFAAFLDVNAMIEGDPEVEIFFRCLSGEQFDGYDLNDLSSLTRRPRELLRRLAQDASSEESEVDGLDMALHGFRSFLIFAYRLDSLIRTCSDDPILRSAFWHYHSEYFDRHGKEIRHFVERVLDNLSAWAANAEMLVTDAHSGVSREESLESLEECRWMIARLTSDLYERPLRNAAPFDNAGMGAEPMPYKAPAGGTVRGGLTGTGGQAESADYTAGSEEDDEGPPPASGKHPKKRSP